MVWVAVGAVDRTVAAGPERHLRWFATASAGGLEHLALATGAFTALGFARRAAVGAASRWIVEAMTGVVLLLADGENK